MSGRKQWLIRWAGPILVWSGCVMALTAVLVGERVSRWTFILWIGITAAWVGIACMKDAIIARQWKIIKGYRTATNLLLQKRKAGLS